jgi:hypothetical protein
MPWMMRACHSRLQPDEWWFEPELPEKGRAPLFRIFLTDARDHTVCDMRVAAPGHDFRRSLPQAPRVHRQLPWHEGAYLAECQGLDDPSKPSQLCIQRVLNRAQVRWEGRA